MMNKLAILTTAIWMATLQNYDLAQLTEFPD